MARKAGKDEEKVCLTGTQVDNIIDAARNEKGACQTALEFVNARRPKKDSNIIFQAIDRKVEKRVKKLIHDFNRLF